MTAERTLSIIKPDAVGKNHIGDIISRFEKAGDHHDHLICLKCAEIIEFEEKKKIQQSTDPTNPNADKKMI